MKPPLDIRPEVRAALAEGRPVVALESTLIAHGLPYPRNLETARAAEAAVRRAGAVPATIGVTGGQLRIGLTLTEIERFAGTGTIVKVSRRDLAMTIVSGGDGATTVAATMAAAALAGIRVFATGGIGGVHRGGEQSLDISADLVELARSPVAVISAGAKVILDLPRTLEVLESLGVPVVGYRTGRFPGFYCRDSGLDLESRVETAEQAARLMRTQWELGLGGGLLFANPAPEAAALDRAEVEALTARAVAEAQAAGVAGKALTPYLLQRLAESSGGRTLETNMALVVSNAKVAGEVADAYAALDAPPVP